MLELQMHPKDAPTPLISTLKENVILWEERIHQHELGIRCTRESGIFVKKLSPDISVLTNSTRLLHGNCKITAVWHSDATK